jgi:DNA-binding MarR family transcriptional regulator
MNPVYTLENYASDESIGFLLKRTGMALALSFDRSLAEFDMTHAQLAIFVRLLHRNARTASDLARDLATDSGAMTRLLDRLEEKEFVKRTRSNADRRVVEVALTQKGKKMADQMTQVAVDALNKHLQGFSAAEIAQFKDFLLRMIANS